LEALESEPSLGAVGALNVNADGSRQPSWGFFPTLWSLVVVELSLHHLLPIRFPMGRDFTPGQRSLIPHHQTRDVDWVAASALLVRRRAVTGPLFLEGQYLYFEECELCHRLHAGGWRIRFQSDAEVLHLMQASVGQDRSRSARLWLRGAILFLDTTGKASRWSALVLAAGAVVRAAVLLSVSAVSPQQARRRRRFNEARAYWSGARELVAVATGRVGAGDLVTRTVT
jgi:GT2 family glycosyltransferase